ncbi:MAG: glycoside hydrolase N-terminal domain-containing protein, partial [Clostridia bacterium]|nr:glycoside hydrolase N-terminal domain-containing protein [Clostridia bacterium]
MKKGLDKELRLWYDEPAIDDDKGSTVGVSVEKERVSATNLWARKHENLKGWEEQALALGNGYMGAKVFGGVEHE